MRRWWRATWRRICAWWRPPSDQRMPWQAGKRRRGRMELDDARGRGELGQRLIRVARLADEVPAADIAAPALLKLDVQGFELQALAGCNDVRCRRIFCSGGEVWRRRWSRRGRRSYREPVGGPPSGRWIANGIGDRSRRGRRSYREPVGGPPSGRWIANIIGNRSRRGRRSYRVPVGGPPSGRWITNGIGDRSRRGRRSYGLDLRRGNLRACDTKVLHHFASGAAHVHHDHSPVG